LLIEALSIISLGSEFAEVKGFSSFDLTSFESLLSNLTVSALTTTASCFFSDGTLLFSFCTRLSLQFETLISEKLSTSKFPL